MKLIYTLSVGPINSNWNFFSSRYSLDFRGLSEKRQHIFGPFGPPPLVSNIILYNLEIILSYVSISRTSLPLRVLMSFVKASIGKLQQ